ncbi:hypothetical protein N7455_005841 [Penicillium solitum]|uniref:uncharacterized protein n=1 Tax=Penicillium solitum TaxID=60172 RepID=UPI0018085AE8|nr:hypothetical protein HAV15_010125 [Penicillium sp. str. \
MASPSKAAAVTAPSIGAGNTETAAQTSASAAETTSEASTSETSAAQPTTSSSSTTSSSTAAPTTTSADPTTTSTTTSSTSSTPAPESTTSTPEPTSTSSTTTSSIPSTTSSTTTAPSTTSSAQETTFTSTQGTTVVVITSTQTAANTGASSTTSSSATDSAALATSTSAASSGGLSPSGTIAVAVVVPVVSVALIILALLFFWRKRKANKAAEEERRKEVEEYGFNPNNDPTLPGIGGAVLPKDDQSSGYRGWGTTSAGRKASTNLSSGMGGLAMSEGSGPGYHHGATPSEGTVQYSDGTRPDSGEIVEPIGVLGAAPVAANNRNGDIHRGPSNASSAYSAANRSDASEESHMSAVHPSAGYYGENPYYGDMNTHGAYGGDDYQPVIRDVQARRNTRIENPGVYPRQGNAGIAQNF